MAHRDDDIENWIADRDELQDAALNTLPVGFVNYNDGVEREEPVVRQRAIEGDWAPDFFEPEEEEPFIPRMAPAEEEQLNGILQKKMRHLRRRDPAIPYDDPPRITREFANPDGDNNFTMREGEERVEPWFLDVHQSDEDFFDELKARTGFIRQIAVTATTFDDAIVEVEVVFIQARLQNLLLVNNSHTVARVIAMIVYRYIGVFFREFPQYVGRREFKVQVGFSAIFKKNEKRNCASGRARCNGEF